MSKLDVDALLGNLLTNLGDGKITEKELKKASKPKKVKTLSEESVQVFRIHKPSMTTTRLLLIKHVYVCNCGAEHEAPNMHVLTEKKDKYGNLHITQYVSSDDISDAKREVQEELIQVNACQECFAETQWLVPVTDKNAQDSMKPVENKMTFNEIADILGEAKLEGEVEILDADEDDSDEV